MRHAKSQRRKAMKMKRKPTATVVLALVLVSGGGDAIAAQTVPARNQEKEVMTQSKFFCNTKALNPDERAHHKLLTDRLVAQRTQIIETDKGYEFQYNPSKVSLAELAEWVAAESKCCPFFGFHIDLENEGKLLCLRLTGEEGVKAFLRAEFLMSSKP
jgi:hypothetical protein